MIEQNS